MIETYNEQVFKRERQANRDANVDDFVDYDDKKIKWSSGLKQKLESGQVAEFTEAKIRQSLYRPFTKSNLYFDRMMNDRVLLFPSIFPTSETETDNRVIWLKVGQEWPMFALMVNKISETLPQGASQCFPFYTYNEDGTNRRETLPIGRWHNIGHITETTPSENGTSSITSTPSSITPIIGNGIRRTSSVTCRAFHTHPTFGVCQSGSTLGEIHVGYEDMEEYPLSFVETPDTPLNWNVKKMKLSKDKTSLVYNEFLTLDGIQRRRLNIGLGIGQR